MRVLTPKILLPSVWPPPRSLATTSGISVDVFSSPYLDVSVQAVPRIGLFDSPYAAIAGGFPHSVISGSMLICSSPKLFAAYHDLHRLLMPRHSPCALFSLTFVSQTLKHFAGLKFWLLATSSISALVLRSSTNLSSVQFFIGSLIVELCRLICLPTKL